MPGITEVSHNDILLYVLDPSIPYGSCMFRSHPRKSTGVLWTRISVARLAGTAEMRTVLMGQFRRWFLFPCGLCCPQAGRSHAAPPWTGLRLPGRPIHGGVLTSPPNAP